MGIRKSSRSRRPRARPVGLPSSAPSRNRNRDAESLTASPHPPYVPGRVRQLTTLALQLRAIYGTAVAAELALRQQCADEDREIADYLRAGVCNPIADQIRDLEDLARRLRSEASEFSP